MIGVCEGRPVWRRKAIVRTGDAKDLVCGTFVIVDIDVDPKPQVPVRQHS